MLFSYWNCAEQVIEVAPADENLCFSDEEHYQPSYISCPSPLTKCWPLEFDQLICSCDARLTQTYTCFQSSGFKKRNRDVTEWVICTDHLYNQLYFLFFSSKDEFAIVENNIKLFTELPLVAWNASCIFLYWGVLGRRDFKCLHPIVHISVPRLWRLLCDPFAVVVNLSPHRATRASLCWPFFS